MTSIIEKRRALHKSILNQQKENETLKSRLSRLQALANIGTITSMIAHEINNLLTPISNYASLALNNPDDKSLTQKALEKTVRNCTQASKIMESMLRVTNGETQDRQNIRLKNLIEQVFECLCRDFSKDGITVNIKVPEDMAIRAVPVQFQQVLMNLILNARDAMLPRGGSLTIKAVENNDEFQVLFSDTGCGIDKVDLKNIFELFYSTKTEQNTASQNSGAGLGLAFCKQIIDAHGGSISVESEPNTGSSFRIILPKNQQHKDKGIEP